MIRQIYFLVLLQRGPIVHKEVNWSMNKYEALYIINPKLDGEAVKAIIEKFANLVTENCGVVDGIEEQGIRKLAYEINFMNEGFYVLMNFSSDPAFPAELERNFKISEDIIRFIVIKKEA